MRTRARNPAAASSPSADPAGRIADRRDGGDHRAGGDLAEGDGVQELGVGHPVVTSTASSCISGTITKPPPNESAPTLSAVQARAPMPPEEAAAVSAPGFQRRAEPPENQPRLTTRRARRRAAPARGRDRPGSPPAPRQADRSASAAGGHAPPLRGGSSDPTNSLPARTATAATAAPAPAPAPRTQSGGEDGRKRRESARTIDRRRDHESEPSDHRSGGPADPIGAEDRELSRGRSWEQGARGVRVFEGTGVHPAFLCDQLAQERDVGRGAAEAGQPDPQPLPGDRPKGRGRAVHTAAGCQAPTRSSSGGCWRLTWPGMRRPSGR